MFDRAVQITFHHGLVAHEDDLVVESDLKSLVADRLAIQFSLIPEFFGGEAVVVGATKTTSPTRSTSPNTSSKRSSMDRPVYIAPLFFMFFR